MSKFPLLTFALLLLLAAPGESAELHHGTFRGRPVEYQVIAGLAVYEGDIILGPAPNPAKGTRRVGAVYVPGEDRRWAGALVPYEIEAGYPGPEAVLEAIAEWESKTPFRFVVRTSEPDWVSFETDPGVEGACFSAVGRVGGKQAIVGGANGCGAGTLIHEIGHAIGMWHEQARLDRDEFVEVFLDNADPQYRAQYEKQFNSETLSPYDFGSVMHYSPVSFAVNSNRRTMRTIPPGIPIGQRSVLSPLDADSTRELYALSDGLTTVAVNPPGARVLVDGQSISDEARFAWAAGSTHVLDPQDIAVSADERLSFARWSDAPGRLRTVEISAQPGAFLANYSRQYAIRGGEVTGGSWRVAEATDDDFYPDGEIVGLLAEPAPGQHFAGWTGFRPGTRPNGLNPFTTPAASGITARLTPQFTTSSVTTIESIVPDLPLLIDGETVLAPHIAVWAEGEQHRLVVEPSLVDPNDRTKRYTFLGWSDGVTTPERTLSAPASPQTLEAVYARQFQLSASTVPQPFFPAISVEPPSADGFYDAGTVVRINLEVLPGLKFAFWQGDLSGDELPATLVMDGPKSVLALMAEPGKVLFDNPAHAASFESTSNVSPGLLVTLFGSQIGPEEPHGLVLTDSGRAAVELGGAAVHVDGIPAPMIFANRTQVTFAVPYAVEGRDSARVDLLSFGVVTDSVYPGIVDSLPGLFTANASGSGPAAALNQDGTLNSMDNPAAPGSIVVVFGSGEGATTPPGLDGAPAGLDPPRPAGTASAEIAGVPARIEYIGGAPGLIAGVFQANVEIPAAAPSGEAAIRLTIAGKPARARVTIWVK